MFPQQQNFIAITIVIASLLGLLVFRTPALLGGFLVACAYQCVSTFLIRSRTSEIDDIKVELEKLKNRLEGLTINQQLRR